MRNYLSFGGGVNSVAMYLYLIEQGWDFEAVFVDHGTDWPETYEYFRMFQGWIITRGLPRITVLAPNVQGFSDLFDYCWNKRMVPSFMARWCTDKFKVRVLHKYCKPPAFELIGIDAGESHRAKLKTEKGFESRYPLVEAGIDREGCKQIIRAHGLPVPQKSGCYICPYQTVMQWQNLRRLHPDLFCKAAELEERNIKYRTERGKKPLYLNQWPKARLRGIVNEDQRQLFRQDEYPPCVCGV